ncbi:MAG: hypothetical protein AVDCRST_MAG49-1676, partial [uncultured Thermomicrobiales bacterium]
ATLRRLRRARLSRRSRPCRQPPAERRGAGGDPNGRGAREFGRPHLRGAGPDPAGHRARAGTATRPRRGRPRGRRRRTHPPRHHRPLPRIRLRRLRGHRGDGNHDPGRDGRHARGGGAAGCERRGRAPTRRLPDLRRDPDGPYPPQPRRSGRDLAGAPLRRRRAADHVPGHPGAL